MTTSSQCKRLVDIIFGGNFKDNFNFNTTKLISTQLGTTQPQLVLGISDQFHSIPVAHLQAEIFQQQRCYILENSKKHPILGVWYTPTEKVLKCYTSSYNCPMYYENL